MAKCLELEQERPGNHSQKPDPESGTSTKGQRQSKLVQNRESGWVKDLGTQQSRINTGEGGI